MTEYYPGGQNNFDQEEESKPFVILVKLRRCSTFTQSNDFRKNTECRAEFGGGGVIQETTAPPSEGPSHP